MNNLDWNQLRSFVAVAESGSLSGAARVLGVSQPTVGRHMNELAATVGVVLFERRARGMVMTQRGAELYDQARRIREGVDSFQRRAAGLDEGLRGTVRISAADVVSRYVLPQILARISEDAAQLQIEVVSEQRTASLSRREADIAVRMFRPTQGGLIAKRVANVRLGLYASAAYVKRFGAPRSIEGHRLIGLDQGTLHLEVLQAAGFSVGPETFQVRSDCGLFHFAAVEAGLGIGGLQEAVASRRADFVRVLPEVMLPTIPVWVVTHGDLQRSPRVRVVHEALTEGLRAFYGP